MFVFCAFKCYDPLDALLKATLDVRQLFLDAILAHQGCLIKGWGLIDGWTIIEGLVATRDSISEALAVSSDVLSENTVTPCFVVT